MLATRQTVIDLLGYEPGFAANLIRSGDNSSMNQSTVEFHIQNEDFPALPGASAPGSTTIIDNGGGTGCNILLSQQMQPQQQQQQQLILVSPYFVYKIVILH
jgi:hypothetical protein